MIDTLVLVVILAGSPVDSIGSPEPCAYVRYETPGSLTYGQNVSE